MEKLRSWKHTGFDFWIGPELTDAKEIVQIGMYTVRSSAAAGRLVVDDEQSPTTCATESEDEWIRASRRSWARLIQLVFELDPLLCECDVTLKVISVIETRHQSDVAGKILKHIKYQFEVLVIPSRASLPSQPCRGFDWGDSPAAGACSAQ